MNFSRPGGAKRPEATPEQAQRQQRDPQREHPGGPAADSKGHPVFDVLPAQKAAEAGHHEERAQDADWLKGHGSNLQDINTTTDAASAVNAIDKRSVIPANFM